ncbi:MAG: shikimate dehydrogenase [Chthonomonas sp.]|nr:shikimate dehydrogenase [Chthonomonas sp.]
MAKFAFVVHPIVAKDAAKRYPILKYVPDRAIEWLIKHRKSDVMAHVTGLQSKTGATAEGIYIGCPLTPGMMMQRMPLNQVYDELTYCTELAHREGAKLIGLGAFTSVVGDGGITVEKRSPIPVTTGNSYTVATAIEGALRAAEMVGVDKAASRLAVVGATGSIGRTCAMVMAPMFRDTVLIGRDLDRTAAIAAQLPRATASIDINELRTADLVVTVTSAETAIIEPEHLRRGAIVCDVSRPRDTSVRVAKERPDVLVIEGGVVKVPGNVDFGMTFGFPPGTAYACMSETMMLALEDKLESFTLGKEVSVEQVEETNRLAAKHGFEVAGFRAFERGVDDAAIERTRQARMEFAGSLA